MAQITLSNSNSKNIAAIAGNDGFRNRVRALIYEHALNLLDLGATGNDLLWANAALGGTGVNDVEIAYMMAVHSDPAAITIVDTLTDAQLRSAFDAVSGRAISAWAS